MVVADAFLVNHTWNGYNNKYVTLERSKADSYAVEKHGYIEPLYTLEKARQIIAMEEAAEAAAESCKIIQRQSESTNNSASV